VASCDHQGAPCRLGDAKAVSRHFSPKVNHGVEGPLGRLVRLKNIGSKASLYNHKHHVGAYCFLMAWVVDCSLGFATCLLSLC
jgi:hypothetical protein